MSDWLGTVQLAALVCSGAGLVTLAAGSLLYPLLRARIQRLAPSLRARVISGVAAAPLALPAVLVFLCLLPSLLGVVASRADHCPHHPEHFHLCVSHRPAALPLPWAAASLLGALPVAGALWVGAAAASRARGLRRALQLGSSATIGSDVHVVASTVPICVTAGVLQPRIFVSEAFAAELPASQLQVAVEHERAHARRRDGLRKLAAAALSGFYLPSVRRRLLADLSLACEQACDAAAARRVGDPVRVAEAIVGAARLLDARRELRGVCAFGGSTVPERVERLLGEDPAPDAPSKGGPAWLLACSVVAAAALFALADPLHHGVEHFLAMLLR